MTTEVTILLATYNGEKYIRRQMESLLSQTYTHWRLIVRDDSSTDKTLEILLEFAERHPEKIFVDKDMPGNLGAVGNFGYIFSKHVEAEYIMFCDQDDYWLPNKVEKTLAKMQYTEKVLGKTACLLVHTNFTYVDEQLVAIKAKQHFNARRLKELRFQNLLVQNPVYGCTSMINNSLAKIIKSIPPVSENHDYWVALVASAFGQIVYIPESTVLYRQHAANISTHFDDDKLVKRFKKIFIQKGNLQQARNNLLMAHEFSIRYNKGLDTQNKKILDDIISFLSMPTPLLLIKNIKNGVRKQTVSQTVLFYLSAYFLGKK